MDRAEQLAAVVEAFQPLKFGEIYLQGMSGWLDEVIDSNFVPRDVPFSDIHGELEGCRVETLLEIATALYDYLCTFPAFGDAGWAAKDPNLLTELDKAGVPLKELLTALAFFIYAALKSKQSDGVATRGCLSGAVVFLLCTATKGTVPAGLHQTMGVTSLFIQSLYTRSLDVLALPESWVPKKVAGKKGRALAERNGNGADDLDDMDIYVDTTTQWEEAEPIFLKALVLFVRNLDLEAFPFNLSRPYRTLANLWKRSFPEHSLTFDASTDVENLDSRKLTVAKFFSLVLSLNQKNVPENLEVVFWALEPFVLRLSDTLTSYQTLTRAVEAFSENVTQFCVGLIRRFSDVEDGDEVIERFLKDVFHNIPDTAEYRRRLAETFVGFLDVVKPATRLGLVRWLAEEGDADRVRGRGLVLCVMQVIWNRNWEDVSVPYLKCTTRQAVVLEICMRRLPDKSAKIRGSAAAAMSALLQSDPNAFDHLLTEDHDNDQTNTRQGPTRIDQLFSTVLSGISDVSVVSRKAYLQMLGRLLVSSFQRFDQNVKDAVLRVAQDPAKSMRTSSIDVICELVKSQDVTDVLSDMWIRGVFHLYMDSEDTIKERVAEEFQKTVLDPVLTGAGEEKQKVLAWKLIEKMSRDEQGEIRLLRQILFDLEKGKILTLQSFRSLQAYVDGDHKEAAWILLAEVASIVKCPSGTKNPEREFEFAFAQLTADRTFENGDDIIGACVFRLIQAALAETVKDTVGNVERRLGDLEEAFPAIRGVATVVEAVRAILAGHVQSKVIPALEQFAKRPAAARTEAEKNLCLAEAKLEAAFAFGRWAQERILEAITKLHGLWNAYEGWLRVQRLAEAGANADITPEESDISFSVRLIAEMGMHLGLGKSIKTDAVKYDGILDLLEKICDFPGTAGCRPWVRAHAVFALGRLCLGAKKLTWQHSTKLIDLANSQGTDPGLRRDAIVVVFDLLKMFGDVIEKDLGKVYGWLGDRNSAIRGDVINHLHDLLLNEHLQWNPAVFYQFLTSISDPSPTIREWVRSCLRSLMKKRNQCFTDFSEAIVFLNGCAEHPRFKVVEKLNAQGMLFPLSGVAGLDKRLEVYAFMLKQLTDEQKRMTYARILEQLLMPVVTREIQIDYQRYYRDVLLDVIRILGLKEMEFSAFIKNTEDDENDEEGGENENDAEQAEDEALRKQQKQSKAVRKENWIKFKQEIVQRMLLPVLGSVYRQVRNLVDAPGLLQAVVRLVDYLTKGAEIDLTELAQSTSGFDGQILKALAMDIKRLQEAQTPAPVAATTAPPGTPAADDIPLIRESPPATDGTTDDLAAPVPTPAATNNTVEDEAVSDSSSEEAPAPKKPRKPTKNSKKAPVKKNGTKVVVKDEEEEEEDIPLPVQRKTRRGTQKSLVVEEGTSSEPKAGKSARDESEDWHSVSPPPRSPPAKVPKKDKIIKAQEKPVVAPPSRRTRGKRATVVESEPEEESEDEQDDTLMEMPKKTTRKTGPLKFDDTSMAMGPSRAISTPNKNRTMNVTFGADISLIDAGVSLRTVRSAKKSRGPK